MDILNKIEDFINEGIEDDIKYQTRLKTSVAFKALTTIDDEIKKLNGQIEKYKTARNDIERLSYKKLITNDDVESILKKRIKI